MSRVQTRDKQAHASRRSDRAPHRSTRSHAIADAALVTYDGAIAALRRVIGETVPDVACASATPFASYLDAPLAQPRLNALLISAFAAAAATLASIGLFGVMATGVRTRTREFGVRMALGATFSSVAALVFRRGMRLGTVGAFIGIILALSVNRLLTSLLYDVSPWDVGALIAGTSLLLIVAAVSSVIPARASARIQPAAALRAE